MKLIKCSSPVWIKEYDDMSSLIDELRSHICGTCLSGGEDDYDMVVDVEHDGKIFKCRDILTLLSTPCGCEYTIEYDDGTKWWEINYDADVAKW